MIAPQLHSIQDSPPDQKTRGNETSPSHTDREKALRELRERLDYRWREVVEESNIDPTVALERGYYLEKTKRGLARLGFPRAQQKAPALVIPRFNPAGEPIPCQIKPDIPTAASDKNGKPRVRKYESPPGHPVRLSVPPRVAPMMRNVSIPLWLTEGDKKGDALASVGEAVLALQGVDCYRVLEDWDHVRLAGREVIIAFDADVMVNPNVQKSLQKLARFLQDRGALVRYVRWPEKYRGTKTGVDDYLSAGGDIGELRRGAQDHPDEDSIPVGIKLSDVERETIKWFWERLVPYGKITVMDGDPGLGKSVVVTDLAARQTAGADLPYGTGKLEAAGVVMLAAEDDAGDTILPRFEAAGGVAERVILLGTEEMLGLPSDIPVIERAMKRVDARLVVIDPLMAFFDEDVNPNGDKDVRRALIPLKHLAARTGAAFLLVRHPNKMVGQNYLYRGGGSVAIVGTARAGLLVGPHPEDDSLWVLAGQKTNLGPPPAGLKYRIITAENGSAAVRYEGSIEMKPQDLLKTPMDAEEKSALDEAKDFLREVLPEGGKKKEAAAVKKEAADLGIAERTLKRAKNALGVHSEKTGEVWFWYRPQPGGPADEPDTGADTGAKVRGASGGKKKLGPLGPLDSEAENGGCDGKGAKLGSLGPHDKDNPTTTEKQAYISGEGQGGQGGQGTTDARRTDAPYVADAANEEGGQVTDEACQETPDEGGFGPLAYAYVTDDAGLEPLVTEVIAATGPIALDTETFDPNLGPDDPVADGDALDVRVAQVRLIQVRTAGGEPWLVDGLSVDPAPLLEVIKDKALIMHNAKYDLAVLRTNFGYVHDGPVSDTMLAAQVLYAGRPNVGAELEELADSLLEIEIDKGQQRTYWGAEPLSDAQLNYAAADVEYLHELDEVLRARVKKSRGLPDVVDLENRMVKVIAEMTAVGMPVDERVFAECVDESDMAIAEQRTKLDALITAPIPEVFVERNTKNKENVPEERNGLINWNSNPQILWAFESAGLKLPATNKGVLADYEGNPLVDALLALRQKGDVARRFRETRVEGGRAHATWKQIEAKTGRMACENPPLQGVPEALKRAFVAPPGHKLVVSDLSQIEIRVLAALSGDENLRQEFLKGTDGDIHRAVAANVLGIPREDVTKQQRGLAKSLVFGLVYGQGLKGFSDKAREVFRKNYTEEEVDEKFWRPFFEAYAGVAQWRDKVVHRFNFERRRDAYTQMGRRRLHLTSHRQALNSPIQGGAADVMKSIAVAVYERRSEAPGLEIVGLIHDEILVTVPEEHAAAAAELVHEVMKEVGEEVTNIGVDEDRRVPVDAATQVCGCWAEKG